METPSLLRELFEQAALLPPERRVAFIATCPDAGMRERLLRMFEADASGVDEIAPNDASTVADLLGDFDYAHNLPAGTCIGPFELLAVLGEGGSSTVFRATRETQGVRQHVALKLLRRGLYSPDARRQFRRERQALSQLQHIGIARLIEGGVTDSGVAYIALDLVDGMPITDYAREHRLDLNARLRLFLQICHAVEAAHHALIVHRDLKPSNVLVTNEGQVKLLDFGIAKLLDAEDDTQTRLPAFTPAYSAPEQRSGALITTATDVYALGVLLGELITGERMNDGSGRTPSAQISEHSGPGVLPAAPRTTRRQLRGDLDNIVLKAIEAEPARRYVSAGALADDIERLLEHRPVAAHPPSRWYRTRKFVARHKGGVMTATAFLLAIFAALAIALWQANVARLQTRVARAQTQRAEAVRDMLVGIFESEKPARPRMEMPDTAELLKRGVRRARDELAGKPAVQSELLIALGKVYNSLARLDDSEPLLDEAIAAARKVDPADPGLLGDALTERGEVELSRSHYASALALFDEATPLQKQADASGLALAHTLNRRAVAESQSGKFDQAIADQRASLQIRQGLLAADDAYVLDNYNALGLAYTRAGRAAEGTPFLRKALDAAHAKYGEAHIKTMLYAKNYAYNQGAQGHYAQAAAITEDVIRVERTLYDETSPDRAPALANLGGDYAALGRLHASRDALEQARTLNRNAGLTDTAQQIFVLGNLGFVDKILGDTQGLTLLREAEQAATHRFGAEHGTTVAIALQRAELEFAADPATATSLHDIAEHILAPAGAMDGAHEHGHVEARYALGLAQSALAQDKAAGATLKRAVDDLPADQIDPVLLPAVVALAQWQRKHDADGEAEALLRGFVARAAKELPATHYALGELKLALAELLAASGRSAEARENAIDAQAAFAELPASHPWRQRAAALTQASASVDKRR